MAIAKENKRVIITMSKDLYDKVHVLANVENRSVSNYIITLLKQKIEKQ